MILSNDIYLCSVELTEEEALLVFKSEYEYDFPDLEADVYITIHEEFLVVSIKRYIVLVERITFEILPEIKQKYKVYKLLK